MRKGSHSTDHHRWSQKMIFMGVGSPHGAVGRHFSTFLYLCDQNGPVCFSISCGQDCGSQFLSWEKCVPADARKLDKLPKKELRVLTKLSLSSRPTPTESLASSTDQFFPDVEEPPDTLCGPFVGKRPRLSAFIISSSATVDLDYV